MKLKHFEKNDATYEKNYQLQYLDMVLNETLRIYVPFLRMSHANLYFHADSELELVISRS